MSSSGVSSTTNGGNSGVPLCASRSSMCPRARRFVSALMIPPRKKPVPISRGWPATAMGQAPPGKNTAPYAASTSCWASCISRSHGGPATPLSVPVGCELYLKAPQAQQLNVPYRSRSQLVRDILDFLAAQVPERAIRSLADGGYATKDYVRRLPKAAHVVGRFPMSAKLYALPPSHPAKRRGAPRKKGALIGAPKTLAQTATGWVPHPSEAGAAIQDWCGLWHPVLPGRLLRVVFVRRAGQGSAKHAGQRKPPPPIEAFFTTDLSLSPEDILTEYHARWAVEVCQTQPIKMT